MSENTTSETVTETPKKKFSILTDAAMRAKAKMTSADSTETADTTPKKMNLKKFAIGVGVATAGIVAVYGALKLLADNIAEVEAESDEDEDTNSETNLND